MASSLRYSLGGFWPFLLVFCLSSALVAASSVDAVLVLPGPDFGSVSLHAPDDAIPSVEFLVATVPTTPKFKIQTFQSFRLSCSAACLTVQHVMSKVIIFPTSPSTCSSPECLYPESLPRLLKRGGGQAQHSSSLTPLTFPCDCSLATLLRSQHPCHKGNLSAAQGQTSFSSFPLYAKYLVQ